jgi:ubiquinone/menaquinone biosynthesis C-methylase UbiE
MIMGAENRGLFMAEVHHAARSGFSKASSAYVSGRPGYPKEIDSWLRDTLGMCSNKRVVDLAAGTGKFTAHLLQTGADVIAVEPVQPMLDELRRSYPSACAKEGNATHIPLEDESADALFCAQAFHWFASEETMNEIRRVLKPGGVFGLIWNIRDETTGWVAALSRIMAPHEKGAPRFHEGQWRSVFPTEGFGDLREATFEHAHRGHFETVVVDRIMSVSFIASLPQSEREEVGQQVRRLVHVYPGLSDETDVTFPYRTFVTWTEKSLAGT